MTESAFQMVRARYRMIGPLLNERERRLWVAAEALALPRGGVSYLSRMTGMSRTTIHAGIRELRRLESAHPRALPNPRCQRRPGAGRKEITVRDETLAGDLQTLMEPRGAERRHAALRWTTRSTRNLAAELNRDGHRLGERKLAGLLESLGYRLQAPGRGRRGPSAPVRAAQFGFINARAVRFQIENEPVVVMNMRKADVESPETPAAAAPAGARPRWGTPGQGPGGHTTALEPGEHTVRMAVESLGQWWDEAAARARRTPKRLLLVPAAGDNHARLRELLEERVAELARETGLAVDVSHLPRGTCRWTSVEYQTLRRIVGRVRGGPPVLHEVVVRALGSFPAKPPAAVRKGLETARDRLAERAGPLSSVWNYRLEG